MSAKKITIQDIARHAKVSAGTVDRVIHNRGKVSADKKRRIEDAVKEHNFNPNMLARALSMRNQFTVCSLFPQISSENEYWQLPKQGAEQAAEGFKDFGFTLETFYFSLFDESSFIEQANKIIGLNPDGVILAPLFIKESILFVKKLEKNKIPYDQTNLKKSFSILAGALNDEEIGNSVPGFHLEGPYISPVQGYRGAHLEKYIRIPDWDEFSELQKAARGRIKLITIAPEVNGAISFTRKCTEAGVVVSLGHHNGSAEIIKQAADAGASMSTHLGNGCANLIDRHENPLWAQLADDRITVTIIADGFHLNREEVQCFYKMKGLGRTILVSDALDLAGLPPGEYIRVERVVVLTPDVVKYPAENVLAGAASPLVSCVSNIMKFTGCSLENAIQMATANPARLLGLNDIGVIKQGKRADLILFTVEEEGRIEIQKTILAGKEVYSNN